MPLLDILKEVSLNEDDIIQLNPQEAEKMADLFNDLGLDIDQITVNEITEERVASMSATERFEKGMAIRIKRNVHQSLRDMIDEGLEQKDWYYEISSAIYESLGESEGCLFLLLLASTSPMNMLTKNFNEASVIYKGFKQDIEQNEQLLRQFLSDDFKATDFQFDEGSTYGDLEFVKSMSMGNIGNVSAKIMNIKKSFSYYYQEDGNLTKEGVVGYLSSKFNPYSDTIKGIIDISSGDVLQRSKVYNFAINLLMPEHSVDIRNKKWYFVTTDTWMIRAMYPYLPESEQSKVMNHNAKYLYTQEKIMDFAKEVKLEPHQVQASIWTAKLGREGRGVDSFSKVIEKRYRQLRGVNDEFKSVHNIIKSLIDGIYDQQSVKPSNEPTELAKQLGDKAPF